MASETRQLPNTQLTRLTALETAVAKDTATGNAILTAPTSGRAAASATAYRGGYDALMPLRQTVATLTAQKSGAHARLKMSASHFVQVFDFMVDEGFFPVADRAFYNLPISNNRLPDMSTEDELKQVATALITGDAARVAAGGAAMIYPIARVVAANTAFVNLLMPHSTAVDALDAAQEALDLLEPEADKVVKKVWDEIETFYNEEAPASQRQNARQWGVKYVLRGTRKHIDGFVKDLNTNVAVAGAEVKFENGTTIAVTDANGYFELSTSLMGQQDLLVTHSLYHDLSQTLTLVENQNIEELVLKITPLV